MEFLTVGAALDYIKEVGGSLTFEGERVKLRLPGNCPSEKIIVETIRANCDVVASMLRDRESKSPSLNEVTAMLPPKVRIVSYRPKTAPFAVAPVSIVTNTGKFFRAYIRDLAWKLEDTEGYSAPPLTDILIRLAEAGLELRIETPAKLNEQGMAIGNDEISFSGPMNAKANHDNPADQLNGAP
jgi:hypothetical protein